jgi:hypothetical protein
MALSSNISVPRQRNQKHAWQWIVVEARFLLSIWQKDHIGGDVRERSDEIPSSEVEAVLAEAESLLIDAVPEAARHPDG